MGDTAATVGPLDRDWGRESGGTRRPGDSLGKCRPVGARMFQHLEESQWGVAADLAIADTPLVDRTHGSGTVWGTGARRNWGVNGPKC